MTCLAFNSSRRRERNADASKPLYIPGGSDSLEAIGGPPGATPESLITSHWARRWDIWQQAVRQHFKEEPGAPHNQTLRHHRRPSPAPPRARAEDGAAGGDEEGKEEGFAEADVDKARARKECVRGSLLAPEARLPALTAPHPQCVPRGTPRQRRAGAVPRGGRATPPARGQRTRVLASAPRSACNTPCTHLSDPDALADPQSAAAVRVGGLLYGRLCNLL